MNNWYFFFYLFSIADSLNLIFQVLGIVGICFATLLFIGRVAAHIDLAQEIRPELTKFRNVFSIVGLVFLFLYAMIPDKKDIALIIVGGSVGQFVMNDENAKEIPADITRFIRAELLSATSELTDDAKEALGLKTKRDSLMELSKEELINIISE